MPSGKSGNSLHSSCQICLFISQNSVYTVLIELIQNFKVLQSLASHYKSQRLLLIIPTVKTYESIGNFQRFICVSLLLVHSLFPLSPCYPQGRQQLEYPPG